MEGQNVRKSLIHSLKLLWRSHWGTVIGWLMVLNRSVTLFLPFLCSASDGLERTPFLLKETWTLLPLVEAGNDFLTVSSLAVSFKDFILSRIYSACVTKAVKKRFLFLHHSLPLSSCSGHFGLWVDENLYLGRSSPCYTFNNCCLSETDDFRVMELEVWTFSWRKQAAAEFL